MIKLIAADMDGTLLDSQKRLPPDLFDVLGKLRERGVRFAVASGRQYYNLVKQFPGMENEILFLCENGTMIFDKGAPIFLEPMEKRDWQALVKQLREIPGACPILCCPDTAYCEDFGAEFAENASMYYEKLKYVDDLLKVEANVCKIAVYDLKDAETNSYPAMKKAAEGRFQVTLSGERWIDIMGESNKGTALTALEKLCGVSPEETMAFGDYLNDTQMMRACFTSCAMENAHPDLKKLARFWVPSNDENGVIRTIRRMTGLDDGIAVLEAPYGSPEYRGNLELRDKALRKPLGLDLFSEDLSAEKDYRHFSAVENGEVVGTMMLLPDPDAPGAFRMKQAAVAESCRGKGIGRRLWELVKEAALRERAGKVTVHARKTAAGFYEKLGFSATGGEFLEVGIPHIPMEFDLRG